MLKAAIALELVLGKYVEAGIIAALLSFNAALGFFQEGRAETRRHEEAVGDDCLDSSGRAMETSQPPGWCPAFSGIHCPDFSRAASRRKAQ
jgi:hypothetical protein